MEMLFGTDVWKKKHKKKITQYLYRYIHRAMQLKNGG